MLFIFFLNWTGHLQYLNHCPLKCYWTEISTPPKKTRLCLDFALWIDDYVCTFLLPPVLSFLFAVLQSVWWCTRQLTFQIALQVQTTLWSSSPQSDRKSTIKYFRGFRWHHAEQACRGGCVWPPFFPRWASRWTTSSCRMCVTRRLWLRSRTPRTWCTSRWPSRGQCTPSTPPSSSSSILYLSSSSSSSSSSRSSSSFYSSSWFFLAFTSVVSSVFHSVLLVSSSSFSLCSLH